MDRETALKAKDDLAKLYGRRPYNDPSNICWNDGIYAQSLVTKWGMSTSELDKLVKKVLKKPREPKPAPPAPEVKVVHVSGRVKLPPRRLNENRQYKLMGVDIDVSFGIDPETLDVKEVFVNTRKFGTAIDVMMRDTCVLISFLLQHGEDMKNLLEPLSCDDKGNPEGFAGLILKEIIALDIRNDYNSPDRSLLDRETDNT